MDITAIGGLLGGLTGAGGLIVALNGRIEARAKAKMAPMELTDRALEVAGQWIDRLALELRAQEEACERELAKLRDEIAVLRTEIRRGTMGDEKRE